MENSARPRNRGRRSFLYTSTGAALGMPFLASLLPRGARAQAAAPIRRFVGIQSMSGQIQKEWYPTKPPAGYQLKDAMFAGSPKADGTVYLPTRIPGTTKHSWAKLSDFAQTGLSNILGNTLNAHLDKVNLLRGIDILPGNSHSFGAYFGNYSSTNPIAGVPAVPTVDQVMAYKAYPAAPRLRSLNLGTGRTEYGCSFTNYGVAGGKVEYVPCRTDPALAWEDAFKGFMAPSTMPGPPKEHPNRSLVNAVYQDVATINKGPRLSTTDRALLDRHMTFLADIERKLAGMSTSAGAGCKVGTKPASIPSNVSKSPTDLSMGQTVPLLIDITVAAFMCDITRVSTMAIPNALYTDPNGVLRGSFHDSADTAGDWHQFAHDLANPTFYKNFVAISQWIAKAVFAAYLDKFDAMPDADGKTLLDNSLIVWGNELGLEHMSANVMTIMGGSAGGKLNTGYYVDYIDWTAGNLLTNKSATFGTQAMGVAHNRWLVTMLQAMGLQPADYETAGQKGYSSTKLNNAAWGNSYDLTQVGVPLPGIWAGV